MRMSGIFFNFRKIYTYSNRPLVNRFHDCGIVLFPTTQDSSKRKEKCLHRGSLMRNNKYCIVLYFLRTR